MRASVWVVILLMIGLPVSAQSSPCAADLTAVYTALKQLGGAPDTTAQLLALDQAQAALALLEAGCSLSTPEGLGQTRSQPIPLGGRGEVEFSQGAFAAEFIAYTDDAAALLGEIPEPGHRYVAVEATIYCRESVNERCTLVSRHWNAVGSHGIVYSSDFTSNGSVELFGGAQAQMTIPFEVEAGDEDLVLFIGRPEMYFATES